MTKLKPVPGDERDQLVRLWSEVFGDPPALAETFLSLLPELGCGWAAVEDGRVLGAAYLIDALELDGKKCGYLYAVAVYPQARGRGLGAKLSRACFQSGRERGAEFLCTEPAEPSLFRWYETVLGVTPALCREKIELASRAALPVHPLSPEAYAARRETLLADRPHVRYAPAALRYEAANCRTFGGGLYAVGDGIAAASVADGMAVVRECLGAEREVMAASVGAALGCEKTRLFTAADEGEPFLAAEGPFPPGTVWNLAFD